MGNSPTALLWFRQDLRLHDNPALRQAVNDGYRIIPVFILDDRNAGRWKHGGASRWWLHQSLNALNQSLNGYMAFRIGDAEHIIPNMIRETGAEAVFWNRCYEPWRIDRDRTIKAGLKDSGVTVKTFNASLLWEPWNVLKDDGAPYKVFTPYYRKGCLGKGDVSAPLPAPRNLLSSLLPPKTKEPLESLDLMPQIKWHAQMQEVWQPGESGARARFVTFLEEKLNGYKERRNCPDMESTSRLSPHLHFGEISSRELWHSARTAGMAQGLENDLDSFCAELGWREFSTYLLYHNPHMPWDNLQPRFNTFPWRETEDENLRRWQNGTTGIPIVDAGMRQLWQTGWMHNRVRMITASLLVKNMGFHWRCGAEWFWDTLVDADLANNAASWQWVAGSGADASPYFRIFNPVTQGEKFDPRGDYIRTFVPELRDFPDKHIHAPWTAPHPPANYPAPIVDLKKSRQQALEAFGDTKSWV